MMKVEKTETFETWLSTLRDERGRAKISSRIDRLALGNAGDVSSVGGGVSELRIHFGPGYRVYFVKRGNLIIMLLCGGDKDTQRRDIALAKAIAADIERT